MSIHHAHRAAVAGLAALAATPCWAAGDGWTVRAGLAHVGFSTQADVDVGGARVPGGDADASSNRTLGVELSVPITSRWDARLLVGVPPETTLTGAGALASAGRLGRVTYGPAALTATWALLDDGPWRPYLGAGLNYTIVFRSRDDFIADLDVRSAFGTVLQAGIEYVADRDWSVSLDARKIFLKTKAEGRLPALGNAPVKADVRLDPLVIFASVGRRF